MLQFVYLVTEQMCYFHRKGEALCLYLLMLRMFDKQDADTNHLHSPVTDPDIREPEQHAITEADSKLTDLCKFLGKSPGFQHAFWAGQQLAVCMLAVCRHWVFITFWTIYCTLQS